jgi:hypothetical protein
MQKKTTGDRGTELPPFFLLSVYIFIFNKISLLFYLFFLNLTCSRPYSYNLMLTATLLTCKIIIKTFYLRNKSWKPECVGSFNMGWRILVFYPEPEARDTIY